MICQFDSKVAKLVGVEKAVILYNMAFWLARNVTNNHNFINGRYWTYNTAKSYANFFEFFGDNEAAAMQKVKRHLKELCEKGILVSGEFNKNTFDRTKWYALNDEWLWLLKSHLTEDNFKQLHEYLKNCQIDSSNLSNRNDKNDKSMVQNCQIDSSKMNSLSVQNQTADGSNLNFHYSILKNNADKIITDNNPNKISPATAETETKLKVDFNLKAKLSFDKLSVEYKTELKNKIAEFKSENENAIDYESFKNQCLMHGYKYKNFWLAYKSWNNNADLTHKNLSKNDERTQTNTNIALKGQNRFLSGLNEREAIKAKNEQTAAEIRAEYGEILEKMEQNKQKQRNEKQNDIWGEIFND